MSEIKTVNDLYPRFWLKAKDLGGKKFTVRIVGAEVREFRQPDVALRLDPTTKKRTG